jgi:glycosyltransferase involved in cell wall biosynthesis
MEVALLNFVAADQGGALTYMRSFCRELTQLPADCKFVVLLSPDGRNAVADLPPAEHVEYRVSTWPKKSFAHRLWYDQVTVRRLARELGAGSLYSQVFAARHFPGRQVLALRNHVYFSELYLQRAAEHRSLLRLSALRLRRRWAEWSVRQADVVVTPTRAMLEAARRQCARGGNARQWHVVNWGFDRESFVNGRPLGEGHRRALDALPAGVPRLLFVSAFCEQKNVDTLFDAFAAYRGSGNRGVLILTFSPQALDSSDGARARRAFRDCPFREDILFLGRVPWEEIWNLYALADLFVFPSYLESFGFPMVEAMASGLPVLASDTPVNQEVCGDAAAYFEVFNPADLAEKMAALVGDTALRGRLGERGLRRSGDFSWRDHVRKLAGLLTDRVS